MRGIMKLTLALMLFSMAFQPLLAMNEQYGEAATCEFPTSLHLGLISKITGKLIIHCSGVYVGSGLMLTAAHCATNIDEDGEAYVYFGEDWQDPVWSTSDVECVSHPGGDWSAEHPDQIYEGSDIAYCKLGSGGTTNWPEPPIIPVMVPNSCENEYIRDALFSSPPSATTFPDEPFGLNINKIFATASGVGFNNPNCEISTDAGCTTGIKRFTDVPIRSERFIKENKAILFPIVQPDPVALLNGDSGGPLYFRMLDGSWRLIGLATAISVENLWNHNSSKGELHQDLFPVAYYTSVPRYVRWIENSSGVDITPCHTYNPDTNRWDFTGGSSCADNVPTSSTAGGSAWFFGSGDNVTACTTSLVSTTDACAGWTPPPFNPPLTAIIPSSTQGKAALALAISGQTSFSESVPPAEGSGFFGPTSTKIELFGTSGPDRLRGTARDDEIIAGRGADVVHALGGDDDLLGGDGNDRLWGGHGDDLILPGRGRDIVRGGPGNDTVVLQGTCELEFGEILLGGPGDDTLVSPLSWFQLLIRGVIAFGFETIKATHPDSEAWTCHPPPSDFQVIGGQRQTP